MFWKFKLCLIALVHLQILAVGAFQHRGRAFSFSKSHLLSSAPAGVCCQHFSGVPPGKAPVSGGFPEVEGFEFQVSPTIWSSEMLSQGWARTPRDTCGRSSWAGLRCPFLTCCSSDTASHGAAGEQERRPWGRAGRFGTSTAACACASPPLPASRAGKESRHTFGTATVI